MFSIVKLSDYFVNDFYHIFQNNYQIICVTADLDEWNDLLEGTELVLGQVMANHEDGLIGKGKKVFF